MAADAIGPKLGRAELAEGGAQTIIVFGPTISFSQGNYLELIRLNKNDMKQLNYMKHYKLRYI